MNVNEVIKYPILSEKTYLQMANGVYTFAVDKRTNKAEIKKVVEFIFDVKVSRVNVMNVSKKAKRIGKYDGFVSGYKKAIVKLSEGTINIFPDDAMEAPVETKAVAKKAPVKKEMSEAEKKAAAKIKAKADEKAKASAKPAAKKAPVKAAAKPAAKKPVAKPAVKKAPAKPAAKKPVAKKPAAKTTTKK